MAAANFNIIIEQGTDFSKTATVMDSTGQAVDLTGATFEAKWRNDMDSPVNAVFDCELVDTVGNNKFSFSLTTEQTNNATLLQQLKSVPRMPHIAGLPAVLGIYDILVTLSDETKALIRGTATFIFSPSAL